MGALLGGCGVSASCSAQVKQRMKGMLHEQSTQRTRSMRVRAVLAMHVPTSCSHVLWCLPCVAIHSLPLSAGWKERA